MRVFYVNAIVCFKIRAKSSVHKAKKKSAHHENNRDTKLAKNKGSFRHLSFSVNCQKVTFSIKAIVVKHTLWLWSNSSDKNKIWSFKKTEKILSFNLKAFDECFLTEVFNHVYGILCWNISIKISHEKGQASIEHEDISKMTSHFCDFFFSDAYLTLLPQQKNGSQQVVRNGGKSNWFL